MAPAIRVDRLKPVSQIEPKRCTLRLATGVVEFCPQQRCAFWEEGGAVVEGGCVIERLGLDVRRADVAGYLGEVRERWARPIARTASDTTKLAIDGVRERHFLVQLHDGPLRRALSEDTGRHAAGARQRAVHARVRLAVRGDHLELVVLRCVPGGNRRIDDRGIGLAIEDVEEGSFLRRRAGLHTLQIRQI